MGEQVVNTDYALDRRSRVIGGSEAAAIMGLNPYKSALQVYMDKTGMSGDSEDNLAMMVGRRLEDLVASLYLERHFPGESVTLQAPGEMTHPKYPFMVGHIDRLVIDSAGAVSHGLECKTTSVHNRDEWGEEMTDHIPIMYICQIQHYLAFPPFLPFFDVPVLIGNQEFRTYRVHRDDEFISMLIESEREFMEKVARRIPPEIDDSDTATKYLTRKYRYNASEIVSLSNREDNPALMEHVTTLLQAHQEVTKWERVETGAKNRIMEFMGEHGAKKLVTPDLSISWSEAKDLKRVDWEGVARVLKEKTGYSDDDFSALTAAHTKITEGIRTFRPNWPKEK